MAKKARRAETAPQTSVASSYLAAASVFFCAIVLYACTLAPTVTLVDSGELIFAAHSFGVAHPPGFPLYLLFAHLASLVPIGSVAVRVNFASAVFAALAAGMLTLFLRELIATASLLSKRASDADHEMLSLGVSISAGLLLACGRTLWAYATIAEVYTLNALLSLTVLFLMARWRRIKIASEARMKLKHAPPAPETPHDGWLYSAAAVFGLALGVHHVTVAVILPGIAVLVWRTEGHRFFTSRRLLIAAVLSSGALVLVYLYLPIAASRAPIMNWGNPRSLAAVWRHLSGWQYQSYLSFDAHMLGHELAGFAHLILREFGLRWLPLVLLAGAVGMGSTWKRDRTTFWLLALTVACNTGYNLGYSIAEDKDAYYLPTFVAVIGFAAFGMRALGEFVLARMWSAQMKRPAAALLLLAFPAIALASNWPFNNRSRYLVARDYVDNIQHAIEPDGLLLTLDWQVQAPMLYTREVEGIRPDIKVIDINLLRRSWYFDYLKRAFPKLIARSQSAVDNYLSELRHWESEPAVYAADAALRQRISTFFSELCQSFVRQESQLAPVYLTSDVLLAPGPESKSFTQWLASTYVAVPRGLVFQLYSERAFHDPGELDLQTRGLNDGTLHFAEDDVVRQKVIPAYEIMLINRGRYFALFDQHERAAEAFRAALDFDPNLRLAREGLNMSLAKLPKR